MVKLLNSVNTYQDGETQFETNMELEFALCRPGNPKLYFFKDTDETSVSVKEKEEYSHNGNYVTWLIE